MLSVEGLEVRSLLRLDFGFLDCFLVKELGLFGGIVGLGFG